MENVAASTAAITTQEIHWIKSENNSVYHRSSTTAPQATITATKTGFQMQHLTTASAAANGQNPNGFFTTTAAAQNQLVIPQAYATTTHHHQVSQQQLPQPQNGYQPQQLQQQQQSHVQSHSQQQTRFNDSAFPQLTLPFPIQAFLKQEIKLEHQHQATTATHQPQQTTQHHTVTAALDHHQQPEVVADINSHR